MATNRGIRDDTSLEKTISQFQVFLMFLFERDAGDGLCGLQTKRAVSTMYVHLSRQRRLLSIHIQLSNKEFEWWSAVYMGKTNVPQIWDYNLVSIYIDHLVLTDRWSARVPPLDCLFVIYKLSRLIFRFLKTSSRTEVINKGLLLNWMNARYRQHTWRT